MSKISVFWFRRDLRLQDNTGLNEALNSGYPVLCIFIFDREILDKLPVSDARIEFIYRELQKINKQLRSYDSSLLIKYGKPLDVWLELTQEYEIDSVFTNKDYEPYARKRDGVVRDILLEKGVRFERFKDQVIFEEREVMKNDGKPYTVFTPYKNKWLEHFKEMDASPAKLISTPYFLKCNLDFPDLESIGFRPSGIEVKEFDLSRLDEYANLRNLPAEDATSYLSPHLRFGTISVREVISRLDQSQQVFLSELIWREFFMQIIYHFPRVVDHNFHTKYDGILWRNNPEEFKSWCEGKTGYPMVDAGMRQLNETGYMHNRVRMVVASFLCKHLLIDWKWGEAYFAEKLLDYDLSANNGNWQWAAGTGCDAAPYFRVFNPSEQLRKFDPDFKYVKKWVPEYADFSYAKPIVDHKMARERALEVYKKGIES